ncbi:MAG TPA: tetratricopeptide repeat protein [Ardenticatenaceae bacterium]|jgi:tetratricopeptide (TPR) repeat protein
MPLGIELAASWARMLSPEEIAGEIERSLDFLTTSTRNVPERHRSMRAVFDYSWNLLSEAEQQVLRGLSVFCGGFTRAAGEEVAGATLPFLTTLADKSLVRRTGAGRFDLHELVRQYGAARLAEVPGAQEAARARHCDYYAGLLERRYGALRGPEQRATLDELQRDVDNARAAWDVAVKQGSVGVMRRAARGLALFYELNNWFHEGEAAFARVVPVLERGVAESGDARVALGLALMFQGVFHFRGGGQQEQGRVLVERGVEVLQGGDDREALIDALNEQAFLSVRVGDYEGALRLLHEALALGRVAGYAWGTASSLSYLGVTRYSLAEFEEAYQWFSESYEVNRAIGDPSSLSYVLSYLGPIAAALGKADEARRYCRESLALSEALGVRWSIAFALMNQGLASYWLGDYEEAIAPLQRSVGLYREIGDRWSVGMALNRLGNGCAALGAWDEARRHYLGALDAAREVQVTSQALNALAGLARAFAAEGAIDAALELSMLAREHPQTARYTRPQMEGLLAELLPRVSQEEVAAAEERARGRSLEEVVDETLERYGDVLAAQTSK